MSKEPMATRVPISLVCTECGTRGYKSTRKPEAPGPLEMKKFCVTCQRHTLHREAR